MSCEISTLIIYISKFLDFDWLRAVLFLINTVQKRVNSVQFTQRIIDFDWLINNGVEQEPIKSFVLVAHYLKLKAAKMAGVQSRFLPATQNTIESLKNSAKNENSASKLSASPKFSWYIVHSTLDEFKSS